MLPNILAASPQAKRGSNSGRLPSDATCLVWSILPSTLFSSLPPVAPFSDSVKDRLNVSMFGRFRSHNLASSCSLVDRLSDCRDEGLTARRGACCLDDAVFSRSPNWVERRFIF